jgi:hypothetical protein
MVPKAASPATEAADLKKSFLSKELPLLLILYISGGSPFPLLTGFNESSGFGMFLSEFSFFSFCRFFF